MRRLSSYLFIIIVLGSCQVINTIPAAVIETPIIDADTIESVEQVIQIRESYEGSKRRDFDLIHTNLSVSFNWKEQQLNGLAILELKPYFYPQSQITLDANGFDIDYVIKLTSGLRDTLDYYYDNKKLTIALDREYNKSESVFVEIKYVAKPEELELGGSDAITSDKGLYFINADSSENKPQQIWTQGETQANSNWFPTIDSPNERCTQEMYITVEERFKTLSNGELIYSRSNDDNTRTDYWKMDKPHAPYLFMMAIGEFSVVHDSWNDMDVEYYVEPEYEAHAKAIFGRTPEMLTFFSELLDYKYPWNKYSQVVVRDYVSGAMENTTASVFLEDVQITSRELLDSDWDDYIAHELFHQWFGDLVTCESWSNLPLNESFATYAEYLWVEHKEGRDAADAVGFEALQQYLAESYSKQEDLIRFTYDEREDMFDSHSYAKGSRVLHMLRSYVGDEAFFESLSFYLKKNAFKSVEIHDLRLAFEAVTGEDLNWFFDQWFLASGHPIIAVEKTYEDSLLTLKVWQRQDLSTTPLYKLPLLLDVFFADSVQRYSIEVDQSYQEFEFEMDQEPQLVLFDAQQQLLGEIEFPKTSKELAFQYKNGELFESRLESLYGLKDSLHLDLNANICLLALKDKNETIRQIAVNVFDNYEGKKIKALKESLVSLIETDSSTTVIADAITILSSLVGSTYTDLFKKNLYDSSYLVSGASLFALSQSAADSSLTVIMERFEGETNINMVIPLADYYTMNSVPDKYEWFVEKADAMADQERWYMTQYLGQYLLSASVEDQKKGVSYLENMARTGTPSYLKLAAFKMLGLFADIEGLDVVEKRIDIANKESNTKLAEAFREDL